MKVLLPACLLGAMLLAACNEGEKKSSSFAAAQSLENATLYHSSNNTWAEQDFTPWMSRAELQLAQEQLPAGNYFAHVEGRSNGGRCEYRAIHQVFPAERYDQWAVFWGLREDELFDWELRLLKSGFVRQDMQIFANLRSEPIHQIVWLKPTDAHGEDTPSAPTVADNDTPASDENPAPALADNTSEPEDSPTTSPAPAPTPPPTAVPVSTPAPAPEPTHAATPAPTVPATTPAPEVAKNETKPTPAPADEDTPPRAKPVTEEKIAGRYTVSPGDTLGKIAQRKGTSVSALKAANHLRSDALRVGQKLVIPGKHTKR